MTEPRRLGGGSHYDELAVGDRFVTAARTITETDLVTYINLTWFTEDLFTDTTPREGAALTGRVVPAGLLFTFAEGLVKPSLERTGLAFLNAEIDTKGPCRVGDTIHVEFEVTEVRPTRNEARGLVRTRNAIVNQNGETVLVYTPLRLIKATPRPAGS